MIHYTLKKNKKQALSSWPTGIPYVQEDFFKNPKVVDHLQVSPYIIEINNF